MKTIKFIVILLCAAIVVETQLIYDFFNENNQYDEHVNWIVDKIEIFKKSKLDDFIIEDDGCCDILIYPKTIFEYSQTYFLQEFLKVISEQYNYPLRIRYPIPYDPNDVVRCNTHVVMHFNKTNDVLYDFQMWHNYKTSKLLYLIAPFAGYDVEPQHWHHVFTHPFMKIIVGWRVYHMTSPFALELRSIERIDDNQDVMIWNDLSGAVDFNGKLLNVSTITCSPAHNWFHDANVMKRSVPKAGDRELICPFHSEIPNCSKFRGEMLDVEEGY